MGQQRFQPQPQRLGESGRNTAGANRHLYRPAFKQAGDGEIAKVGPVRDIDQQALDIALELRRDGVDTPLVGLDPAGVTAIVTPWNAPLMLATWRIGPALAAGNTVVIKGPDGKEIGRVAHAFMLTGVRGVGKTTTARILARGLNYLLPDGSGGERVVAAVVAEPDVRLDPEEVRAAVRTVVDAVRELGLSRGEVIA